MSILVDTKKAFVPTYLKGAFLLSTTCIGGGMLAMPLQTATAGFWISFGVLSISWLFMTFTGLLLVETTLWLKNNTHFSSMAKFLLGTPGKILSLSVYLFITISSLVAYTSGGALLIGEWLQGTVEYGGSCILFTLVFGSLVYLGTAFIGKLNLWFTLGLGLIYLLMISLGMPKVNLSHFNFHANWRMGASSFPLILVAFSYQMVVPTVCSYLNYNAKELKKAVILGTTFPFLIYLFWIFLIHGIVPFEKLNEAFIEGNLIADPIRVHFPKIHFLIDLFVFLALVTSYFGLSLALFDFVRDLAKKAQKNFTILLSLFPSLILSIFFPRALIDFLDLSGGFGDAMLSGLIPIAMVWIGRYRKNLSHEYRVPGGKIALIVAGFLALSIFIIQWLKLFFKF